MVVFSLEELKHCKAKLYKVLVRRLFHAAPRVPVDGLVRDGLPVLQKIVLKFLRVEQHGADAGKLYEQLVRFFVLACGDSPHSVRHQGLFFRGHGTSFRMVHKYPVLRTVGPADLRSAAFRSAFFFCIFFGQRESLRQSAAVIQRFRYDLKQRYRFRLFLFGCRIVVKHERLFLFFHLFPPLLQRHSTRGPGSCNPEP